MHEAGDPIVFEFCLSSMDSVSECDDSFDGGADVVESLLEPGDAGLLDFDELLDPTIGEGGGYFSR